MQIDYLFYGLKGFKKFRNFSYIFSMTTQIVDYRLKILNFYTKFGLNATIEAFNISKITIYRWQNIYKNQGLLTLNPKSKLVNENLKQEIKKLREKFPNLGKERIYHILKPKPQDNLTSIKVAINYDYKDEKQIYYPFKNLRS